MFTSKLDRNNFSSISMTSYFEQDSGSNNYSKLSFHKPIFIFLIERWLEFDNREFIKKLVHGIGFFECKLHL